jgi:Cft2 family RNA processing exonuclease
VPNTTKPTPTSKVITFTAECHLGGHLWQLKDAEGKSLYPGDGCNVDHPIIRRGKKYRVTVVITEVEDV